MSCVPYVNALGSSMYVMVYTRIDISHTMGVVIMYTPNPGRVHIEM
jgi:hypothetical protein